MKIHEITLIPGDGIGPEVAEAAVNIIEASGARILWEKVNAGKKVFEETGSLIPNSVFKSIEKNKVVLKGPITTPIGSGFRSINVALRKKYDLYANIRPIKSMKGLESRYEDVDLIIFRENTEGLYIGIERVIDDDCVEAVKKVTRTASKKILKSAFEYAAENGYQKLTVAHKANILKLADGMFLETARQMAKGYDVHLEEVIIDNMCMQMVMNPAQFGVIVTMNLYGDILSDLGAGLVGGLGMIPGGNVGDEIAIFEAVHGSAPDIAGKGLANPIALTLSGAMMLRYIGETEAAGKIEKAISEVIEEGKTRTADLGGNASTEDMKNAIISKMNRK
ncbi:MAG: isocitrate/isopropylmalate dehydrogenase family protein [Peptostreptococcaceae bacterium]|nr:isocitrate/isopropylmalate dehydrogenase family protein [Peptostreptococcaceae bacterium]